MSSTVCLLEAPFRTENYFLTPLPVVCDCNQPVIVPHLVRLHVLCPVLSWFPLFVRCLSPPFIWVDTSLSLQCHTFLSVFSIRTVLLLDIQGQPTFPTTTPVLWQLGVTMNTVYTKKHKEPREVEAAQLDTL